MLSADIRFVLPCLLGNDNTTRTHHVRINHNPDHPPTAARGPSTAPARHLLPRDNGGYGVHEVAAVTLGEFRRSVGGTGAAFLGDSAPAGAAARRRGAGLWARCSGGDRV